MTYARKKFLATLLLIMMVSSILARGTNATLLAHQISHDMPAVQEQIMRSNQPLQHGHAWQLGGIQQVVAASEPEHRILHAIGDISPAIPREISLTYADPAHLVITPFDTILHPASPLEAPFRPPRTVSMA